MQAGKMERLVAFDRRIITPDGHGGNTQGWSGEEEQLKAWAHFRHKPGSEAVINAQLAGRKPIVVTIHNQAAAIEIDETWRMRDLHNGAWDSGDRWTGPIYNVKGPGSVSDDRQWIEFMVEGGTPA